MFQKKLRIIFRIEMDKVQFYAYDARNVSFVNLEIDFGDLANFKCPEKLEECYVLESPMLPAWIEYVSCQGDGLLTVMVKEDIVHFVYKVDRNTKMEFEVRNCERETPLVPTEERDYVVRSLKLDREHFVKILRSVSSDTCTISFSKGLKIGFDDFQISFTKNMPEGVFDMHWKFNNRKIQICLDTMQTSDKNVMISLTENYPILLESRFLTKSSMRALICPITSD